MHILYWLVKRTQSIITPFDKIYQNIKKIDNAPGRENFLVKMIYKSPTLCRRLPVILITIKVTGRPRCRHGRWKSRLINAWIGTIPSWWKLPKTWCLSVPRVTGVGGPSMIYIKTGWWARRAMVFCAAMWSKVIWITRMVHVLRSTNVTRVSAVVHRMPVRTRTWSHWWEIRSSS